MNTQTIAPDHTNLTTDQKSALGEYRYTMLIEERLIFDIEHEKYKNYRRFSADFQYNVNRQSEIRKKIEELETPQENINLFNQGVYTGLINPAKISYIAYFE